MYRYYVLYLAWWWLNEPKHIAKFLILTTNMCCVYWLKKLLYYCKTQLDGSYQNDRIWVHIQCRYTGCPRRNGQNFERVFLMLNYTDITQNTYIQSWTVMEIMAIEKCGLLGCPHTVRCPWRHTRPLRMHGNQTPLANVVMQWPWRDNEQLRPA